MFRPSVYWLCILSSGGAFAQNSPASPAFDVASVKLSNRSAQREGKGVIHVEPNRISGRGLALKDLIVEAYHTQYSQISRAADWLDTEEYDLDARTEAPATRDQMRLMLRTLLADRFKLKLQSSTKEMPVYALVGAKDGPKLRRPIAADYSAERSAGISVREYRCDLAQFAGILAIQLSIPFSDDPSTPSRTSGAFVPVLDKTGLDGVYEIDLEVKPDPGGDAFTTWQRALQSVGLKLEAQRAAVEIFVVEHAEKIQAVN